MKTLSYMALLLLVSCAGANREAADADDAETANEEEVEWGEMQQELPPEGPPVECLDDGEPVECDSNEDCAGCENFECGYDPDGSQRVKICLWTGGS